MKAKFLVNPSLKRGNDGVSAIRTDLLMLTKMGGLGSDLGPSVQAIDLQLAGQLSERIKHRKFKGKLGEHLTMQLDDQFPARNVVLVGLGNAADFDYCGLEKVIGVGVARALALDCTRLSMEVPRDRLSSGHWNLMGMANAVKGAVEKKLAEVASHREGVLEVELICTPQAAPRLRKGFSQRSLADRVCCDEDERTEKKNCAAHSHKK